MQKKIKKEESKEKETPIDHESRMVAIVIVVAVVISFIIYLTPDSENKTSTESINKYETQTTSEMSQTDKQRIKEIMDSVMQNKITITPELKNEFKSILAKYNTTDSEMNYFANEGTVLMTTYQNLFFNDALKSVSTNKPVKSSERSALEKELLSKGLITTERIDSNNREMSLIASHKPVINSDGNEIVFTKENITETLNNIESSVSRLKQLLD